MRWPSVPHGVNCFSCYEIFGDINIISSHISLPVKLCAAVLVHLNKAWCVAFVSMFVVVNFDALAQASDFRIEKRRVVFLIRAQLRMRQSYNKVRSATLNMTHIRLPFEIKQRLHVIYRHTAAVRDKCSLKTKSTVSNKRIFLMKTLYNKQSDTTAVSCCGKFTSSS